ncbi:MAG: flavodoxin family protein [Burkholderiales bacterium]|nr:MAG: flavodoxin family protein [Burkholderiales bacterium]
MTRRILILQGHPDATLPHLGHALADAYAEGAAAAGHEVRRIDVAALDVPLLRSAEDWEHGTLPASLVDAQAAIEWCEHLVILFPLWLGDMPALLKAFLEQVARPGFAFERGTQASPFAEKRLRGRSARVVVTMGMPALVYKVVYRAHSVRALERNVLGFIGFAPVRETLLGGVAQADAARVAGWLTEMRRFGRAAG